jgi:hypothetical protein
MRIILCSAYLVSLTQGNQYYCRHVTSGQTDYGDVCVAFNHRPKNGLEYSGTYDSATCHGSPNLVLTSPTDRQFSQDGVLTPSTDNEIKGACGRFNVVVVQEESASHVQGNCERVVRGPYGTLYNCVNRGMEYSVNYGNHECSYVLTGTFNHDKILTEQCLQEAIVKNANENQVKGEVSMTLQENKAKLVCQGISYIAPVSKLGWLVFTRNENSLGVGGPIKRAIGLSEYATLDSDTAGEYKYKIDMAKKACVKLQELKKQVKR